MMLTKTNNWTARQNARRYFLHQKLKSEFEYSAKGRTIQVLEEQLKHCTETARWAVEELREVFGYNVQVSIEIVQVGQMVLLNPKILKGKFKAGAHSVHSISGQTAIVAPLKGRWKKPFPVKIKHLIPINEPSAKTKSTKRQWKKK